MDCDFLRIIISFNFSQCKTGYQKKKPTISLHYYIYSDFIDFTQVQLQKYDFKREK